MPTLRFRRRRQGLTALTLAALLAFPACDRDELSDGDDLIRAPAPVPPGGETGNDCPPPPEPRSLRVRINEVMILNISTLADDKGQYAPWIEIYNAGDTEVNLGNVPLSNDVGVPDKWVFPCTPETILPPKGFLVVFADGDEADPDDLHASFTLTPGGQLQLILNNGSNSFLLFDTSELVEDVSAGRMPDGASRITTLDSPSPGRSNQEVIDPPQGGGASFVRGDLDSSGKVSLTDLTIFYRVRSGADPLPACQDRMDVNDDGRLDDQDGTYLREALFLSGPRIPAPYPEPGLDLTPDSLPCPE